MFRHGYRVYRYCLCLDMDTECIDTVLTGMPDLRTSVSQGTEEELGIPAVTIMIRTSIDMTTTLAGRSYSGRRLYHFNEDDFRFQFLFKLSF